MKSNIILTLLAFLILSCNKEDIVELDNYIIENGISATRHSSGLYYNIIKEGTGNNPTTDDRVSAIYVGELLDGREFDSSKGKAVEFNLNGVIAGWQIGIPLIKRGGIIELYIPYPLAYGVNPPPGSIIGTHENLYFQVELVDF